MDQNSHEKVGGFVPESQRLGYRGGMIPFQPGMEGRFVPYEALEERSMAAPQASGASPAQPE